MHCRPLAIGSLVVKVWVPLGDISYERTWSSPPNYLDERLTPYPPPTKDGGVLRTIGDARRTCSHCRRSANGVTTGKPPNGYSYREPVQRR